MIENITEEGHIVCYTYKTQSSRKCRTFTPVNITDLLWKEKVITFFYTVQRGFAQGSFKSAKEILDRCVTIKMKAIEQHFHVVLFVMLHKVVLHVIFKSVYKTLECDRSNESY